MPIPDVVREAAVFLIDSLPDPPPGHPFRVVRREGFSVGMFEGMSFGAVDVRSIAEKDIGRIVAEAREILAENGRGKGAWSIPEAASPPRLVDRLAEFGMVPYDEPPFEPRRASLVLVQPPSPGPQHVTARPAETLDEFRAASRITDEAFHLSEDDRRAFEALEERAWGFEHSWGKYRTFVAVVDGQIVGTAASIYGTDAAFLMGGSTREDMRGRGVYRALIRARWDDAVNRGTPALAVGAESMSRPILERLGFVNVGWTDCLIDRIPLSHTCPGGAGSL